MKALIKAAVVAVLLLGSGPEVGVTAENADRVVAPTVSLSSHLSVAQAHMASKRGDILLVDIRRRSEWLETGTAETALPISMHESSFIGKLDQAISENPGKPIALICAAGVRSSYLRKRLLARGYRDVIDVPEGMLGSRAGPGWINAGLPIVHEKR